eukprot:m.237909 g.237909  ORF g.237909 m.237909 type:complete len:153 (+) comp54341_c0_seq4:1470-1928(+)
MFIPIPEQYVGKGPLRNPASGLCVNSWATNVDNMKAALSACGEGDANAHQVTLKWYMTKKLHDIRMTADHGARCLDVSVYSAFSEVTTYGCHGQLGNQQWEYTSQKRLKHVPSQMCLQTHQVNGQDKLVINTCSSAIPQQEWHFAHYGTQDS